MGGPQLNDLNVFGTTIYPTQVNTFVFTSAIVNILPDGTFFIRGDSNGDGKVNISDPQATLNYLFVNGGPPRCFDAADANDDGKLDVSDPVRVIDLLFLGGEALPPPGGVPALDPTPDDLGC